MNILEAHTSKGKIIASMYTEEIKHTKDNCEIVPCNIKGSILVNMFSKLYLIADIKGGLEILVELYYDQVSSKCDDPEYKIELIGKKINKIDYDQIALINEDDTMYLDDDLLINFREKFENCLLESLCEVEGNFYLKQADISFIKDYLTYHDQDEFYW